MGAPFACGVSAICLTIQEALQKIMARAAPSRMFSPGIEDRTGWFFDVNFLRDTF
jgi:hypothetical protein